MVACLDVNEPRNRENISFYDNHSVLWIYTYSMKWLTHQHRTRWHSTKTSWQMMPHPSFTKTFVWEQQKSSLIFISLCPCKQVSACCNLETKHLPLRFNKICLFQLLKTHCSWLTTVFHKFPVLGPSCLLSITACTLPCVHHCWIMDDPLTSGMIHLSHLYIYTKSGFQ